MMRGNPLPWVSPLAFLCNLHSKYTHNGKWALKILKEKDSVVQGHIAALFQHVDKAGIANPMHFDPSSGAPCLADHALHPIQESSHQPACPMLWGQQELADNDPRPLHIRGFGGKYVEFRACNKSQFKLVFAKQLVEN